jgi:single-strand DNA-binding protein
MYNKVILVGNLTRDVELKYLPSGGMVSTIGLATNRKWKDRATNEDRQEVMFVDVVLFGRSAEIANQYLKKGSKVLIEGRLALDSWTDQNGQKRQKHKVVADTMQFMDSKSDSAGGGYQPQQNSTPTYNNEQQTQNQQAQAPSKPAEIPEIDIDDEEIPF